MSLNLSVTDFQKISNGDFNAGSIILTKSGKLDKVNNHVGILKGFNNKTISADTIFEVKKAFVKALQDTGIGDDELAKVREELGLPKNGGNNKDFDISSLKPLTRVQTRDILDRYAGHINQQAQRVVISNKWAALKANGDADYMSRVDRAAEVNQKMARDLSAAQRTLGAAVMKRGFLALPRNIQNMTAFRVLAAQDKEKFTKIFSAMLFHGGSDVNSIAADALKKTRASNYCVELVKWNAIGKAKALVGAQGEELTAEEAEAMMDQMSKWEDMQPGQMKKFEAWAKKGLVGYIDNCIKGIKAEGAIDVLQFEDDGFCKQFRKDGNRSNIKIGDTFYSRQDAENTKANDQLRGLLKDKADLSLITGLMNQATLSSIATLYANAPDPDDKSEDPPSLRSLDSADVRDRVANCSTLNENELLAITQPRDEDFLYDLQIDSKTNTAKLVVSADYGVKPNFNFRGGFEAPADGSDKFLKVGYSLEINITGLNSGNPQVASVGFAQKLKA